MKNVINAGVSVEKLRRLPIVVLFYFAYSPLSSGSPSSSRLRAAVASALPAAPMMATGALSCSSGKSAPVFGFAVCSA